MTNCQPKDSIHSFRTEIPNIIFDLGLDPYAFRVYVEIKRIAGDRGGSFASNAKLAERCNMSERKLIECKSILCQPFSQLGNKPLIIIEKRFREDGSPETTLITIEDVWVDNAEKFIEKMKSKKDYDVHEVQGGGAPKEVGVVHSVQEGGAHSAGKEEPLKKIQIKNTYVPTADASELVEDLLKTLKKSKPDAKLPTDFSQWSQEIDRMLSIDNRTPNQIRKVLSWLPTNDFWKTNILSAGKLREKFDQLELKMQAETNQSWVEANRKLIQEYQKEYPNDPKIRNMQLRSDHVLNSANQKDIPFKIPPDQFEKLLAHVFGLEYEET